jgi:iron complex outermembrane receptor protein
VHHKAAIAFIASIGICIARAGARECLPWRGVATADISIPAQPLNHALQALAAQTGLDILFEPETVAGLQSATVHGRMNPGEALCRLLENLDIVYSINPDRTAIIRRSILAGIDAQGVALPDMRLSTGVRAPQGPNARGVDDTPQVIVTGTRRADRSIADAPVPISVIGSESLSGMGSTNTNTALAMLLPSFNFPRPSLTDATDIIRPATLHGLGPDQMLVLVNGKRRHVSALLNINSSVGRGTAAADMSLLPIAAIERIEVLREGAAAQYGSDAIAGVVNVILKQDRQGAEASVTYGRRYTSIEGVPQAAGLETPASGQPTLRPNGTYPLLYGDNREAHDGETVTVSANLGLALGPEGFLDIAMQALDQQPTNRAGHDPRPQYPAAAARPDPREWTFDRLSHHFGEPRLKGREATANAGIPLPGGTAEWYGFGTFAAQEGRTGGFYRTASDPRTVTSLFPNGFLAQLVVDVADQSLATGIRGARGQWNYDASVNYGRNVIDFTTDRSNNASLGAQSPTRFESGGLRYQEHLAHLDARRDFALRPFAKPLSLAWGLEYRAERFAIRAGDRASYEQGSVLLPSGRPAAAGAQGFPGFRPDNVTDRGRHSSSAYLDLEQDVGTRWKLTLAGRTERYSDFGSTLNYKAATRFRLSESVAVRGTLATGFRAPSLHQQFFSATSTNDVGGRLADVGTFAVTNGVARALGARELGPETSTNFGAGIVFDGLDGLTVSIDAYRILIDDRIVLTETLGTSGTSAQNAAVQALLAQAGYASLSGARFFINGMDTRTEGVDVAGSYRVAHARVGALQLSAGYSYTNTDITRLINDLPPLAQIPGLVLFGRLERERIEHGQPGSKLNIAASWQRNDFATTVRTNRYGEVFVPGTDPRDDFVMEPAWITDVELRYSPGRVEMALGSENVFDRYPTRTPTGARPPDLGGYYNVNNYILPFSGFSPFGFGGRYVYGRVRFHF